MDAETPIINGQAPHEIVVPERQTVPLVFASPHSGSNYPPDFIAASRLDPVTLRRSEDSFVDEIFESAPRLGAPLIKALFPRAYIDPNREPFELDPAMFEEELPDYANTCSPRVAAGLGTIARVVTNGANIYRDKLTFAEALTRIEGCYRPYHRALERLIEETKDRFGYCILVDCHSMPSIGGPMDNDPGLNRVDFVLGDSHGKSCAPVVMETVSETLKSLGYAVARNTPYAGGFVTRHYGQPAADVHAIQIEINRHLYMDEGEIRRRPALPKLAEDMQTVVSSLSRIKATDVSQ